MIFSDEEWNHAKSVIKSVVLSIFRPTPITRSSRSLAAFGATASRTLVPMKK